MGNENVQTLTKLIGDFVTNITTSLERRFFSDSTVVEEKNGYTSTDSYSVLQGDLPKRLDFAESDIACSPSSGYHIAALSVDGTCLKWMTTSTKNGSTGPSPEEAVL